MKKKILLLFAICVTLIALAVSLSACDIEEGGGGETATTPQPSPSSSITMVYLVDGNVVGTKTVDVNDTQVSHIEVPYREGYSGAWEFFTVDNGSVYYKAVYSLSTSSTSITTTTTSIGGTTSTTSGSINPSVKYTVKIIDGMTGNVLEIRKVSQGTIVDPLNDYRDLHYGYKMNEEKYNAEKAQKVLKDTDIIIEYLPKTEYTVLLQTGEGVSYTAFEYEFRQRLTPQQIHAGKDSYIFSNNSTNANHHNDFTTVILNGVIKVYEGDSILNIPDAEIIEGCKFNKWLIVTGASDGAGGTVANDEFTGLSITKNYVIRPSYSEE